VIREEQERSLLHKDETLYRTLVENLPGISYIATADVGAALLYVSPQIETLLGFTPAEWLGDATLWATRLHPDDRERVLDDVAHSVATAEPLATEYRIRTRGDQVVWIRHQRIVTQQDGHDARVLGFMLEITARKEVEEALAHQALHDALTGLPNRILFNDRLEQAIRTAERAGVRLALLLMDLDHFKEINDTLGHHVGDVLLQQVGQRVQNALRASDTVARLGGDEFAMVLPSVTDNTGAALMAGKIKMALTQPFVIGDLPIPVAPSIGIALYPHHGEDAQTLLQHADVAMYVAKRGGGGYAVYTSAQDQHSPRRLALISALRPAIDQNQLFLQYQPKMDLTTGQFHGVEALLRWQHPRHGLIPPDEFIPLAEQAGLIKAVALWTLDAGLSQCQAWQAEGSLVPLAINLSARNVQDPQITRIVIRMLENHGVAPSALTIEVTESVLMADPAQARKVLSGLNAVGVRLAIDDFGTGYSSLAYLERLEVHELKIDRSFVLNLTVTESATAIVSSIIGLGHNLGLTIVAEGVESEESARLLTELGCDIAQGYYFSRPLLASAVLPCVTRRHSSGRNDLHTRLLT